jgi:hypothetical protein
MVDPFCVCVVQPFGSQARVFILMVEQITMLDEKNKNKRGCPDGRWVVIFRLYLFLTKKKTF